MLNTTVRAYIQQWVDLIAKEAPTKFEPEIVDVSNEGIQITHIDGKLLEFPEKIIKVEHKEDGTADVHTENNVFKNVWFQEVTLSGPADLEEPTSILVKFDYSNFEK